MKTMIYDYVVVGSGAGGGTLAARLAEGGRNTVCVLEAGGDPRRTGSSRDHYDVPAFHPLATEDPNSCWDFFVRHYANEEQQRRDDKYDRARGGVLYPRAGTLGGCTAHNAMIFVVPPDSDWDYIADMTGDRSWCAKNMQRYRQRLENCHHRSSLLRRLARYGVNPTGHGWDGWLHTEKSIPAAALTDGDLVKTLLDVVAGGIREGGHSIRDLYRLLASRGDPNDRRVAQDGLHYIPLSTRNHRRIGTRERLLETRGRFPDRLSIELNTLATRILFDSENGAVGVECLQGERLYRAHKSPSNVPGERLQVMARKEVLCCGGAFNSPQLLMLSGIGPAEELRRLGIDVHVDLPGVGTNMQDRIEVGVVNSMSFPRWPVLDGATFSHGDPFYNQWAMAGAGLYTGNGALGAAIRGNRFTFPILGFFKGYFQDYSLLQRTKLNYLTFAILLAHAKNRAGRVTLRSADPLDMPEINFNYFQDRDATDSDLESMVDAVLEVRAITAALKEQGLIQEEELPGNLVLTRAQIRQWIKDNCWGHHGSCTCPIGRRADGGVLRSDFGVHGTKRLRIVDASVFPRIPGHFIVSAIYMIAEKAADVILAAA